MNTTLKSTIVALLERHTPSITNDIADELQDIVLRASLDDLDIADCALRECACGKRLESYYDYVDHLKEVLA